MWKVKRKNSSMTVQCTASQECCHRHNQLYDKCDHNLGEYSEKSQFKPKDTLTEEK